VAKVQVVSDLSGLHRQEVYRVLDGLQQLGLVERKVSNLASFSVAPIGDAVKLLLNPRTVELNVMAKKAERLTNRLCKNSVSSKVDLTLRPCFGTIVEADRGGHYRQAIKNAHKTFEATTSWSRFKQLSIHFETQLLSALRRGVKIQVVTEKPANQPLPKWVTVAQARYLEFELRTMPVLPTAAITIFDYNKAAIAYNSNISVTKGPELWTENPTMTALVQAYFEVVWDAAKN
jgi:sugar-specific transcriptional regulator TrmB